MDGTSSYLLRDHHVKGGKGNLASRGAVLQWSCALVVLDRANLFSFSTVRKVIDPANASIPFARKTLVPTPPFSFGNIQSSFSFNVDEFWPTLDYNDHS